MTANLALGLDIAYDIPMRKQDRRRTAIQGRATKTARKTQTTLRLPRTLYERAKQFVERGNADSVNEFIVSAVSAYVRAIERKTIDDAFRLMAEDKRYQREAFRISEQFAASDAEAVEIGERDLAGA